MNKKVCPYIIRKSPAATERPGGKSFLDSRAITAATRSAQQRLLRTPGLFIGSISVSGARSYTEIDAQKLAAGL